MRHLAKLVPAYKLSLGDGRSGTPFNVAIVSSARLTLKASEANLDSIAFLQYIGGTTGLSNGAVLSRPCKIRFSKSALHGVTKIWFLDNSDTDPIAHTRRPRPPKGTE